MPRMVEEGKEVMVALTPGGGLKFFPPLLVSMEI